MNPIFPSILSTNYFNLEKKLIEFSNNNIQYIHLDVMDGHFVENISFGPSTAKAIKAKFDFKIDAHLMVSNPREMIPKFIQAGSDWISFHIETREQIKDNIQTIREHNCQAGLVLNPDTNIETIFDFLNIIDYVLIMSVFPGYGGQSFISSTLERIVKLKSRIEKLNSNCLIQVDGGINNENVARLKDAGADIFVIGTFLFNSDNINTALQSILKNIHGE